MNVMNSLFAGIVTVLALLLWNYIVRRKKQNVKPAAPVIAGPDYGDLERKTLEDWKRNFESCNLGHQWDFLKTLSRDEISISTTPADESLMKIGESKIGGRPDLPNGITWPKENDGKSLSFLAQLNFIETKGFDKTGSLPTNGIMYVFYSAAQDAWGFDTKDQHKFKVLYYDGDTATITRSDFESDLDEYARYKPCRLSFSSAISFPNYEYKTIGGHLNEQEVDVYLDITSQNGEINKLLGHSDNIQNTMELECQLVTNGIYVGDPSGYSDPRVKELEKYSDEWILLFQLDSVEQAGMMWGDVGRIYIWIMKHDLAARRFEKAWLILQCS